MESCEWLNEVASNLRWQKVFRENGDLERAREEEGVRVEACGRMGEYGKRLVTTPLRYLRGIERAWRWSWRGLARQLKLNLWTKLR